MASALQVLSGEEINFLRVANLLIRHSPKAVRILFDREFNPSGLTSVLSKNRVKLDKLKKKHVITQMQWSLLFPSGSLPDSSSFDLTLMVCLLRNLTKITIQDKLPRQSDISEGAAVSRIKFYRNQIAHSDSGAMSDSEFSKTFDEVSMAIEIICPPMKTDCETLKLAHIDHSVHDIYLEFVKNEKQMGEMKQQQKELVAQVEILNVERQNIESIQTEEITEWKKKLETFHVTEAANRLIKIVKDKQCTIITGVPGSGKSAIAYHVAICMQETEGYTVVPVWIPSELIKLANSNAKQLFIFDDVFGKYSLNEFNLNCWESETRRIKMLLNNKVLKVMVTCRSYLYDNVRDSLSSQSFEHFNMQSDELKLSLSERKEISKLYLTDDVVSHLHDETVMMYNFFPLLCVMFKEKNMDNADFFQNPSQFIENEIENFRGTRDLSFICLALLVLSNNSIEKDGLQMGQDKYDKILKDLFDELDIRKYPSKISILLELQHLKNMYLDETESTFCTKHDKIFDIVSHSIGQFMIRSILRHGESAFISSRCQLTSLNEQYGQYTIMICDELKTMYFERILKDIDNGFNWDVFASIQMKFEKYRSLLIQYLEKSRKQMHLSRKDCTTALHVTAATGYFDMSKFLVEKCRKQILSLDSENRSPLHYAAMNGHYEISSFFLRNGARIGQKDNDAFTPLLESCNNGNLKVTEVLLKQSNASVNICGNDGWYPLHMAASEGNSDLIKILVRHKGKVNKQMKNGMTPLYLACHCGHLLAVKLLLERKADAKKCENERWSPLNIACSNGFMEIADVLIVHGADVNTDNNTGQTPLYNACRQNNTNLVKSLLHHQADANKCTHNGWSPLHKASSQGNAEIVNTLLIHGASVNQCNENGFNPLHVACADGNENTAEILIKAGAAVNKVNRTGNTALLLACNNRHNEIAKLLLDNGAEVNSPADDRRTSLYSASEGGNIDLIKILMEHDADVNFQMKNGMTPIYIACVNNHIETVKLLLRYNADINKCEETGWGPLHVASHSSHKELVEYLCENSVAEVNCYINEKYSPLYLACQVNNEDIVKLLLRYGASINHGDQNGFTLFHKACSEGDISIVELLIKEDAAVNLRDRDGKTPLYIACDRRHIDVVELLLKHGAEVDKAAKVATEAGWTPLHVSASSGDTRITELLLQNNAIVNLEDRNGHTPLYYATQNKFNDIIEFLVSHGAILSDSDVRNTESKRRKRCSVQ
ncbi:ankyrin-3-like [Mytilus trossulus]|uniref:ankyrin-3-like n=1 Tax=Mytilus trossulus TaxID=6551 RepID=UPI0030049254